MKFYQLFHTKTWTTETTTEKIILVSLRCHLVAATVIFASFVPVGGNTACFAPDGKNLECKFPENINITRKDFVVVFYPTSGDHDEKLVDCAWLGDQLHCIKQDGFECKQPVSTTAEISIPTRFATKVGNYKCIPDGYKPDDINICNFPGSQDEKCFSDCAVISEDKFGVNVTCRFSLSIESFAVKKNTTVVASYTKSSCLSSRKCHYHDDNDSHGSVFTVMLEAPSLEQEEYSCVPETSPPQFQVKACKSANVIQTETPSLTAIAVILSILGLVVLVTGILLLRRRIRRPKRAKNYDKENQEENLETLIPDQLLINDEKCVGTDKPVTISKAITLISRAIYPDCTTDNGITSHNSSNDMNYTQELPINDKEGQRTTQSSSNALILPQSALICGINNKKEKRCINVPASKYPVIDREHDGSEMALNMQYDYAGSFAKLNQSQTQKETFHCEDICGQTCCTPTYF